MDVIPWTFNELKAADVAIGIEDLAAAAVALNAQSVARVRDIPTAEARAVLLLSGEWFRIKQLAKLDLNGTARDRVVAAADVCVDTLTLTTMLHTADEATWTAMQPLIGGLQQAGVLSAGSVAAWEAMRTPTVPVWSPPVTAGDIQTARAQS